MIKTLVIWYINNKHGITILISYDYYIYIKFNIYEKNLLYLY
jgi:hypothetical protein